MLAFTSQTGNDRTLAWTNGSAIGQRGCTLAIVPYEGTDPHRRGLQLSHRSERFVARASVPDRVVT